jgi:lysozyme
MDIYSQLERDEGIRTHPYTDTTGNLTIGVGRNLSVKGLTPEEIEFLLLKDVHEVTIELEARLPWFQALDAARQGVIVNMAFNMGFSGLETFPKFLAAVAQGDWETAASEMLNSEWAKQVGVRANRLAVQMKSGVWV